jgi:hypothetical protein
VARLDPEWPWGLCQRLTSISVEEAPVGDRREYLPFCGALGIGEMGATHGPYLDESLECLRRLANDGRWRIREAVAMALQRLIKERGEGLLDSLEGWIESGSWLEMRAVAAGLAEPSLLGDRGVALRSLDFHRRIVSRIKGAKGSAELRVLRKGLGYSLSVVVREVPEEGFECLRELCTQDDQNIRWIIRQNLRKNRLVRKFPERVHYLQNMLGQSR